VPLLERVAACGGQPVVTNPDRPLRALAHQRGWPVLDLFESAPRSASGSGSGLTAWGRAGDSSSGQTGSSRCCRAGRGCARRRAGSHSRSTRSTVRSCRARPSALAKCCRRPAPGLCGRGAQCATCCWGSLRRTSTWRPTPRRTGQISLRRAIIIGRRFRLVHVMFGAETIEVSTFRAYGKDEPTPTSTAAC